jgi:hypothetical protein
VNVRIPWAVYTKRTDFDLKNVTGNRYRSNAEIMSRVDFGQFKEIVESARMAAMQKVPKKHFSSGKDVSGYPFLLVIPLPLSQMITE